MSKQYPGGIVSKTPVTPTSLSAPGIWTMNQQAAAQATNTWPFPRDPQFNYVTMLLHGDGSAGAVPTTGVGAGVSTTVTNFNADASTNNFNVTINGDAKSNNFTPYQEGYYSNFFDGSTGYLSMASNAALNFGTGDATVEFWFNGNTASLLYPGIFSAITYNNAGAASIRYNNTGYANKVFMYINTGGDPVIASTSTIAFGVWAHIAIVRQGTSLKLYLNGTLDTTVTISSGLGFDLSNGGTRIGRGFDVDSTNGYFTGYLSNLRAVKGTAVYTSNFTPSTTPLTAITNTSLLTCQSNRFIDNSTNAFTLTVNGSPQVSPAQPFTLPTTVATYGSGYFDGTGDYLTIADNAVLELSTSSFTMEWWSYPTTFASNQFQLSKCATSASTEGFLTYINTSGVLKFNANSVSAWDIANDQGTLALKLNAWNHCAISRNGSSWRMWVNGVSSVTITSALGVQNTSTAYSIAGAANGSAPFLGYITDTRIVIGSYVYDPASSTITIPTTPLTAVTNTQLLTTQYNGGGNNSGFKDSSQFNFPITRNGNTTQGTFTPYGSNWGNYFNGSSYFQIASTSVMNMNTYACLECWVNLSSSGANQLHVGRDSNYWIAYSFSGIGGSANKFVFSIYNGSAWSAVSSSTSPTVGTWYHVAGIRSGSTLQIYINGVLETTGTLSGTASTSATPIGIADNQGTSPMTGYLSNVRVNLGSTSAALPYTANFTPSTSPLTAVTGTQLLTCQSNRFVDNSASPLTLTVNGSPSVQRFSPFAPLTVYNPATYGGSAYFDGTSANIITTNTITTVGTQDFCLEAWVYCFSTTSYACIIGSDGAPSAIFIEMGTARGIFLGGPEISLGSAQYNRWVHIVFCRVSNTYAGFVNGVRQATGSLTNNYSTATKIGINNYAVSSTSGYGTTGYIADGRLIVGSSPYSPGNTTLAVPTAPLTAVTGTVYLASMQNAAVLDNGMMNDLQTVGNAAVSTSVKKYGAASMYFEGTSPYGYLKGNANLSQNVAFGTGDFTVECWVYLTTTASDSVIMDARPGSNSANYFLFYLWTNAGAQQPTIAWYSPTSYVLSTGTVSSGTWTHIAICRASGTIRSFKDGVLQQSASDTRSYLNPGAPYPYIGAGYSVTIDSFKGYIDDFRITKYARYTANFTVPDQAFPNG